MHHEAGVKTIVAGGLPQSLGPIEAVAGNRGARDYEADFLALEKSGTETLNPSLAYQLPDRDIDFHVVTANFDLQDQVRRSENLPLRSAWKQRNVVSVHRSLHFWNEHTMVSYHPSFVERPLALCQTLH